MRTFALLFAFLPLTMAFMANGAGGADYVFNALLLLLVGIDTCSATFKHHAEASNAACRSDLSRRVRAATEETDLKQAVSALVAFDMRGAA